MLSQLYNMKSSTNQKNRTGNRFRPKNQEEGPSIKINCMKLTDASLNLKSETVITRMLTSNNQTDGIVDDGTTAIDTLRPVKTLMPWSKLCGANCTNCINCKLSAKKAVTPSGNRPFSVVYDQMHIENDATPMGLGMEADDTIAILPSVDLFVSNPALRESVVKLTTRRDKTVSLGLNISIGEEEGGLPYPMEQLEHDPSCFEGASLSSLHRIVTNADRETAGSTGRQALCHSEITHTKYKMEANEVSSICQLLTDILLSLQRCRKKGRTQPSSKDDPCEQLDNILFPFLEETANEKTCFKNLLQTFFLFQVEDDRQISRIRESSFYVGPVRNSTPWNYLSSLPIVQLALLHPSTVDELAEAWNFYVMKEEFKILEMPTYLLYNEKKIPLGQNINVVDVIDMDMKKHYFCLPPITWKDEKSVDRLMEFIEGSKPTEQGREKKKKKKKKAGIEEPEADKKGKSEAKATSTKDNEASPTSIGSRPSSAGSLESKEEVRGEKMKSLSKVTRLGAEADRREKLELQVDDETLTSVQDEASTIVKDERPITVEGEPPIKVDNLQEEQESTSHTMEKEVNPLTAELKDKEARLHELLTSDISLVESKGREMSQLISAVDKIEDEKHTVQKKVAEIDANMRELQISKDQLVKDMEDKDQKLEKLLKKKHKLEKFIAERVSENKQSKGQLEKEIEDIKARLQETQKSQEMEQNKIENLPPENQKLLEYINSKIDAKEKELECPVCLEVASIPIFCCDDQHIICTDCRPKVIFLALCFHSAHPSNGVGGLVVPDGRVAVWPRV